MGARYADILAATSPSASGGARRRIEELLAPRLTEAAPHNVG
ncbi:hypothetical protein [Rathayibacter agropyri]|nr:hypothetical protein [Rathayibacter agropyri]